MIGTVSTDEDDPVLVDDVSANDANSGQSEGVTFSSSPRENPVDSHPGHRGQMSIQFDVHIHLAM